MWSLETCERIDSLKAHHRSVLSLYVAKDEDLLFSSGGDAIVNVSGHDWNGIRLILMSSRYGVRRA